MKLTKIYLNKYYKFEALANKLINTTSKEENQIIVKNIEKKININFLKWMNLMIE